MRLIMTLILTAILTSCSTTYVIPKMTEIKVIPPDPILSGEIFCLDALDRQHPIPLPKESKVRCVIYGYSPEAHKKSIHRFRIYRKAFEEYGEVIRKNNARAK